jgi:hypothetical protein
MRMNYFDDDLESTKRDKTSTLGLLIKVFAIVLVVISLIFLIYGLIPHDRVPTTHTTLSGGVGCYKGIPANEGDIMVVDFDVEGNDVSFYLTYGECWSEGNHDYLEKKDHVRSGHLQINIDKTGDYFLNFENNDPSSSSSFNVDLSYKVMDRYSPLHIILGIAFLGGGLILTIIYLWLKKKPSAKEPEYIRL